MERNLNQLAKQAYDTAMRRGKMPKNRPITESIERALTEEVEEVLDSLGVPSAQLPQYLDTEEEIADVIIVCLTYLHALATTDIEELITAKMNYNDTRKD